MPTTTRTKVNDLIIYQLMPDRFARATGHDAPHANLGPRDTPGSSGRGPAEFYGGTLLGIAEQLDHIRSLGANTILLTPILAAPSYHRYDATDLKSLDGRLGTWDDLDFLLDAVHRRGMKILCDLPLNHISRHHPWFAEAAENPESSKRGWFTFLNERQHLGWWGNQDFPELRLDHTEVQQRLWQGPDSVLRHWLRLGFDGVRLDCANDLTLPICRAIANEMTTHFPGALLMGEVCNYAAGWTETLDLTQSYWFLGSLKAVFAGSLSGRQFLINMAAAYAKGGAGQLQMLSSHDSMRSDSYFDSSKEFLTAARRLQFLLPGVPMIYSGEEFLMEGGDDPLNRAPTAWHARSTEAARQRMRELAQLAEVRRSSRALTHGQWLPLTTDMAPDVVSFFSYCEDEPGEFSLVVWNAANRPQKTVISVPYDHLYSQTELAETFSNRRVTTSCGLVGVELDPFECTHWRIKEGNKGAYRFYKNWKQRD